MAVLVYEYTPGVLSALEFDATLSEVHSASATVTEHPVEKGAAITDHVRPQLDRVQLEGLITNTPINSTAVQVALLRGTLQAGAKPVAGLRGAYTGQDFTVTRYRWLRGFKMTGGNMAPYRPPLIGVPPPKVKVEASERAAERITYGGKLLQFPERVDRVGAVFQTLRTLCREGVPVRLVTELQDYPDMLITSVEAPRMPEDAIRFQMSLTSVRYVATRLVDVKIKKTAEKRAQTKAAEGAQGYDVQNLDENANTQSILDENLQERAGTQ